MTITPNVATVRHNVNFTAINSQMTSTAPERPQRVGIIAMDIYFPKLYVQQSALELHDVVSAGKYTQGLGQQAMAVVSDVRSFVTLCVHVSVLQCIT